jgi:ParB family chromosome partitioning protein
MSGPVKRKALGKGLSALLPEPDAPDTPAPSSGNEVPVDRLEPNPFQPRSALDPGRLAELAASIRESGVVQPILVRRRGERYQIIAGERRWRAAEAAGLAAVPVTVRDVPDAQLLELALVENVQRADLNAIELALAFKTMAEAGATQEEIGSRVGLDRSSVANHVRLLDLPREYQQDVEEGRLSFGHARALLGVANPERRRHLRRKIVDEGLSVRETEHLARSVAGPPGGRRRAAAAHVSDPEQQRILDLLRERLKTRVRIVGSSGRGRIEIEYFGAEDLGRIASAILDGR